MIIGGGPIHSLSSIVLKMIGLTVGGPVEGWGAFLLSGLVVSILFWEILSLFRQGNSLWIFFLTTIFLTPVIALMIQNTKYIYIRYFFISIPFALFLLGQFLTRIYHTTRYGKWIYSIVLILFFVGNGWRIADLLENGRGQYYLALQEMAQQTQDKLVTIGGEHDFQVRAVLDFYADYLPVDKSYLYVRRQNWNQQIPEWMVLQTRDRREAVPTQFQDVTTGKLCHFKKSYWTTADAESGSNWHIYHCQTTPPTPPAL